MTKKIVKVEDKKNNKLDLNKIKDAIVENKDTIKKVVDIAADLLDDDGKKKSSAKKSTSKTKTTTKKASTKSKATEKSNKTDLGTMIDLAGKILK